MNPRKAREFYKDVAQELGLNEELVKDILEAYWSEVRKTLSEMRYHAINIHNLGTFRIKNWKLEEAIKEYERMLIYNDGGSFQKMAMKYNLEDKIQKLRKAQEFIQKDKEKRIKFNQEKYGKIKPNMGEQEVDPTRSEEQNIQDRSSGGNVSETDGDMQSMSSD